MNVGIYVRVSTLEQAEEGFSIRAQEEKLTDYARIKDWNVFKIYRDEGISGKNITERPAMVEMIKDIQEKKIDNVLVYKIDRLTRSTVDLIKLVELFNENNCFFNSLSESVDTMSASGRMFLKIIGIFAEFERENIIERSKLGFERKVREGYSLCSRTPSYGYDKIIGNKIQQVNKYEATIVLEIFDMFLRKYMSFLDIAKNLNKRGIKTKEGKEWQARTIKNVLTNTNYIGKVRYAIKDKKRNFEVDGLHEPIVPTEIFEATQEMVKKISTKSYTKRPKEEQYFCGFLVCAKCGGKLVAHNDYIRRKNQENVFRGGYRCSNYLKKTCNAHNMYHTSVEKAFIEYIKNFEEFNVLDQVKIKQEEESKQKNLEVIQNLQKELKKFEAKEKEILKLYVNSQVGFHDFNTISCNIKKEKERISQALNDLETNVESKETERIRKEDIILNLKENWELLTNIERRQFLLNFVNKIVVINEIEKGRCAGVTKVLDIQFNQN